MQGTRTKISCKSTIFHISIRWSSQTIRQCINKIRNSLIRKSVGVPPQMNKLLNKINTMWQLLVNNRNRRSQCKIWKIRQISTRMANNYNNLASIRRNLPLKIATMDTRVRMWWESRIRVSWLAGKVKQAISVVVVTTRITTVVRVSRIAREPSVSVLIDRGRRELNKIGQVS